MLEILGLILLCNVNSKNAVKRGRNPGAFVVLTLALWIGMEILGAGIGAAADLEMGMYGLAILFAAIGAVASYLITKNCKPGTYTDPLQAPANGAAPQGGFCPMCGTAFAAGSTVCANCGAPHPTLVEAPVSPEAPVPPEAPVSPEAPVPPQASIPPQAPAPTRMAAPVAPGGPVAQAQPVATQVQAAVPADHTRAIRAGIVVAASWVILFLVQGIFHRGLQYNSTAAHFLSYALLATGVYLFSLGDKKLRITGGIFGAAFALTYALSSYALFIRLFLRTGYVYLSSSMSLPVDLLIRFIFMMLGAALVLAVTMYARKVLKPSPSSPGVLVDAGAASVTFFVYQFIYSLVRRLLVSSSASSLRLLSTFSWSMVDGAVLFASVYFLYKLCTMDMKDLRLRGWGLVWAWIGAIGGLCSLVFLAYTGIVEKDSLNYASAFLLALFALAGYAMLLRGKRVGLYVILGGVGIVLVSHFASALETVIISKDTEYLPLLVGSVVGAVNPVLAWLAVQYSSDDTTVPARSLGKPTSREMMFHTVAAVVNIIMGMIFILSIFSAIFSDGNIGILPIVIILPIGAVFVVCGIMALVLRRSKPEEYPNWMRVFGTVVSALSALVILFILFMLFKEVVD
jgi:hypothetical protein